MTPTNDLPFSAFLVVFGSKLNKTDDNGDSEMLGMRSVVIFMNEPLLSAQLFLLAEKLLL